MKIYCAGIGGIGLSAYASLQHARGNEVMGSDRCESVLLHSLRSHGIPVTLDQSGRGIPSEIDLFVYSEAIPIDAPERVRARAIGVRQMNYFEALGDLSRDARVIAVCGTHGKSSTTGMAAQLLMECGKDPTVVVGTKLPLLGGLNYRQGKSNIFLLEACEYRRNFLRLSPDIILMTTVDGDHFDAFESLEDYQRAYSEFLQKLPKNGVVITHGSDPDCARVVHAWGGRWMDADIFPLPALSIPGRHMQENARLVLGLADILHIPREHALQALLRYTGGWRRMEVKGVFGDDILVIDDYGHHPREIRSTLEALRGANPLRRLICVFQPHTHDRSIKLYADFLSAFSHVDSLILADVYDARSDIERDMLDMYRFTEDIGRESKVPVRYGGSLAQVEQYLRSGVLSSGDLLVCMGAGGITDLAERMVANDHLLRP